MPKIDKKKAKIAVKKKMAKPKFKVGRPTAITDAVLQKLRDAFAFGCTDEEACYYAGIGLSTLYDFQVKYPEFSEEKRILKEYPNLTARQTIVGRLAVDPEIAFKYLERKKKDEFGTSPAFLQQFNVNSSDESDEVKEVPEDERHKRLAEVARAYKQEDEYASTPIDAEVDS